MNVLETRNVLIQGRFVQTITLKLITRSSLYNIDEISAPLPLIRQHKVQPSDRMKVGSLKIFNKLQRVAA